MTFRKGVGGPVEAYFNAISLTRLCWSRGFAPFTLSEVQKAASYQCGRAVRRDIDESHGDKRRRLVDRQLESHCDVAQDLQPPHQGVAVELQRAEGVEGLLAR